MKSVFCLWWKQTAPLRSTFADLVGRPDAIGSAPGYLSRREVQMKSYCLPNQHKEGMRFEHASGSSDLCPECLDMLVILLRWPPKPAFIRITLLVPRSLLIAAPRQSSVDMGPDPSLHHAGPCVTPRSQSCGILCFGVRLLP